MPQMFSDTIYDLENRPAVETYTCTPGLTATFVGTPTVTISTLDGAPISGYNNVPVDRMDTGPAATLEMEKQIDDSSKQIMDGNYEFLWRGTVSLSDGSTDEFDIIGSLSVKPATLSS